ncbi:Ribonuclease P protein subunit p21 [Coemansia sp. BCRC 34301]|nr:Ribonuclease P protein subunit p21 [Coemansia sp. BCRC 34301]
MARGGKDGKDRGGGLPNREAFERMNFLLQSSQFFAALPIAVSSEPAAATAKKKESDGPETRDSSSGATLQTTMMPLARLYAKDMKLVSRKCVLRMSPHIKRGICKVCQSPLLPGISSTTRVKGQKRSRRVITTCQYCGNQTRLFINNNHVLFVDRPEHGIIS